MLLDATAASPMSEGLQIKSQMPNAWEENIGKIPQKWMWPIDLNVILIDRTG